MDNSFMIKHMEEMKKMGYSKKERIDWAKEYAKDSRLTGEK